MYALQTEDKRAKGVKKKVVEHEISFDDYKTYLTDEVGQFRSMNLIRSRKHKVYSEELNKLALSPHDDKRDVLEEARGRGESKG